MSTDCDEYPNPLSIWQWDRAQMADWQVRQFNQQLDAALPQNRFYRDKLTSAGIPLHTRLSRLEELSDWPLTSKQELVESADHSEDGWSQHHTFASEAYSRLHRTSGTKGMPLLVADTAQDWQWWSTTWQHVLEAAQVTPADRVFLAFSFGPFIGFWSAHQACADRGALVIPGGGMTSLARLEFLRQSAATVVCCTPSYALHLAEVAAAENFSLAELPVQRIIVAGESGGSLQSVRQAIQDAWKAQVIDHAGATEVGPWGFGWPNRCGLHVIESSFIAEILPLNDAVQPSSSLPDAGLPDATSQHVPERGVRGVVGELVLTSLGRHGAPVIRYRTGDVVRTAQAPTTEAHGCSFLWLPEGIIGRTDDMITIRGVNMFPSSVDSLVRSLLPCSEYQVRISQNRSLEQLLISIEASQEAAERLEKLLASRLGLRVNVTSLPLGSLPRSEGKSRRWIRS